MASNSEANLRSNFDIDEVINWDEQNYSSKGIDFQLPQLGLPTNAKTSQNTVVTLPNLGSTAPTSQQTSLQDAQNNSSFYSSLFGTTNNPSVVRSSKTHVFPPRQAMVSPNALSFPSQNINIPPLATQSSNSSLLQFASNTLGQNTSLGSQFVSSLENVQNSANLINDSVSPFTDHGIDDSNFIEGPLDKIVNQLIDQQDSEGIVESPTLPSSFDDDVPVITYSNMPAKEQNVQLSTSVPSQNVPSRNVLSPNALSRNVTSPSVPTQNVSSQSISMHRIPSPSAPVQSMASPVNPPQNILSPNPSRNIPVQHVSSTKIIPPNISPPNVPSRNTPSPSGLQTSGTHPYTTIQGLTSHGSEQGIPSQSHSKFTLQTVPSSMVNTLVQSTMNNGPSSPITSFSLAGQAQLSSNNLFQTSTSQTNQRNNQPYPSFMLQNPNQTLIRQVAATGFSTASNMQSKPAWLQGGNNLEELLRMQQVVRAATPNLDQKEFANQLARSLPNFTPVLSNKIAPEQSQSSLPSFMTTNIVTERSTGSSLFTTNSSTNDLKLTTVSSPAPRQPNPTTLNLSAQNINSLEFSQISDLNSTTVANQLQTISSVRQNVPYGQVITSLQSNVLQKPSVNQTIQNQQGTIETTQALKSPRTLQNTLPSNQFFIQNSANVNQAAPMEMSKQDKMFSSNVSRPQNVLVKNPNLTMGKVLSTPQTATNTQQSKSAVFTLVSSSTNTPGNASPVLFSAKTQSNSTQPAGITTIKISSPSLNSTGFKYPSVPTVGFGPPAPKTVTILPPRTPTVQLKSPTNLTPNAFPTFRLTQANVGSGASSPNTKTMVFTLAPGSQAAATLKGLSGNLKDKLTGRPVIFQLQQPSGQPINTPKPQPMKIIFVNESSIPQVVSGPVKSKKPESSAAPVFSQTFAQTASSNVSSTTPIESTTESSMVQDSDAGSPSSVTSADSDSISIATLKQNEALKKKEKDGKDGASRGRKRRKDPNRPVKPLSSFQRFFQAMQPSIRQQTPQATFAEVSKTIKEMWEDLPPKDKKVYQDAWRFERVQYKKAMEDYNASFNEIDLDAPSPKQAKNSDIIEIKEDYPAVNPIPVSPVKTESPVSRIVISPPVSSPSSAPASAMVTGSTVAPPRGKPLAMMAEMANKNKLASAQAAAAAKASSMTKLFHAGKSKASNGLEEGAAHTIKTSKKPKINPLPKKSCVRAHCNKPAKTTKERGTMFCSDDCVMRHCRGVFKSWVETRRETLRAAT